MTPESSPAAVAVPAQPGHARWLPLLLLILLGCLWGLSFSLSKLAATNGIHPFAYVWWQATGAGLFLTVLCWRRGIGFTLDRPYLGFFLVTGSVGLVLPNINMVTTARHVPAGILSTVVTTVPLLTYGLAVVLGMERLQGRKFLGLILGFVGICFIVLPDSSLPAPEQVGWVLLALLTPACYATSTICSARLRPEGTHSLLAAWGMLASASVLSTPLVLSTGHFYPLFAEPGIADWAMLGQIAISCVAYILFFEIIRRAGPVFVSQVGYVVNLFGLGWGYLIFAEQHSAWVWAAVLTVLLGVMLVNSQAPVATPDKPRR